MITREGIGMSGGFWGVPGSKGLSVVEDNLELSAEVWFARVGSKLVSRILILFISEQKFPEIAGQRPRGTCHLCSNR